MTTIHTLDLNYRNRPESVASYVLDAPDGPVMIETGPGATTGALTDGLARLGLTPADVRHVLVTHIHFDHAGAAGWMARHGATVYVHEFGAKHLIDPSRLVASAQRIYGDAMDELWGEIVPIPQTQVVPVHDGDRLAINGIELRAIETPGHARHHHAFALDTDAGPIAFAGDAAGCFVTEAPTFISLPTPPPEFDLPAWLATLDRFAAGDFAQIYPTHFGPVDDVAAHLTYVREALEAHVAFVESHRERPRDEVRDLYRNWFIADAERKGVPAAKMAFYVKDSLAAMNVTGILRYLDKRDQVVAQV
jgi:glyoxylase-like metal-dependent hydrolase (beta-lactamase superfamily II)